MGKALAGTCREIQGGEVMCKFCKKPNKTIVRHILGVSAFVGAGLLWLRFYDEKADNTIVSMTAI